MKKNKNLLGNQAAENVAETIEKPSRVSSTSKKHYESDAVLSLILNEKELKHIRRYSFDDNGGGYQGL